MAHESTAGRRLITQNLLTSAAFAVREKRPDWLSIQDLSLFIELYCLYDNSVVIGRDANYAIYNWDDPLFDLLRRTNFVSTDTPESDQPITSQQNRTNNHMTRKPVYQKTILNPRLVRSKVKFLGINSKIVIR
jgi:hypothetical protein